MNFFRKILGKTYLANTHTGEIHDLSVNDKHCKGEARVARHNRKYVTLRGVKKLIATGHYNGCRWCFSRYNTDK